MAFGKDPRLAAEAGSFRQQSRAFTQNRARSGAKGRVPYFINEYKPGLVSCDTIRLVRGDYLQQVAVKGVGVDGKEVWEVANQAMPFVKFTEHFHGGIDKSAICSAGPFKNLKALRYPCRGCEIFWETAVKNENTGRIESPIMSRQEKYAFSVLDYGNYHKVPVVDRQTGKMRMNTRTNEPFYNWTKCQGQGCEYCTRRCELTHGNMRHWQMSYTHFQQLRAAELLISDSCAACGAYPDFSGKAPIQSLAWSCRNCGSNVIDVQTTELKVDEMRNMTDNLHTCVDCKCEGFLIEMYTCVECAPRGQQGRRAELWDVDLKVQLTETGQKAKTLTIQGWSPPRPVDPNYAQLAKPVDLIAIFAPDSMEYQLDRFGAPKPTAATQEQVTGAVPAQQQYATPYGNKTA